MRGQVIPIYIGIYVVWRLLASLTGVRLARAKFVDNPIRIVGGDLKASAMRTYLRPTKSLLLAAALVLPYSSAYAEPIYQNSAIFKKGDCGLTVEDPHISDSLLKRKIVAIKVNVTSKCVYPQQKVVFEITLLRKGALGWSVAKPFLPKTLTPTTSPYKIEYKDSYVVCKNKLKTIYMARALAKATIGGKVYISPLVYSNETLPIACGF